VRARATIESIAVDADPVTMRLAFTPEGGAPVLVDVSQRMAPQAKVGLEPGAAAEIMYDREDPQKLIVLGSPDYKVVSGHVVRVVDVEQGGKQPLGDDGVDGG
jgi:hypothetical protein